MRPQQYDYTVAGFDGFLSRSIDTQGAPLDAQPDAPSKQMDFDRSQASGALGNTVRIGNINIDGVEGRISVYDDESNEVARFGKLDD
jgi:hypothetical protein